MPTKLKLDHDEMVVLAAIADQKLALDEILQDVSGLLHVIELSKIQVELFLLRMTEAKVLVKSREFAGSLFPVVLYAIAPDILAMNNPPYSYESWRALSEGDRLKYEAILDRVPDVEPELYDRILSGGF